MEKEKIYVFVAIVLGLATLFAVGIISGGLGQGLQNKPKIIESTGLNVDFAFDNDLTTMWETGHDTYAYVVLDYGLPVYLSNIKFLLYSTSAIRWYDWELAYSTDGVYWNYIVPTKHTDPIQGNQWIDYDFRGQKARWWRFGYRIRGGVLKGGVYELELG